MKSMVHTRPPSLPMSFGDRVSPVPVFEAGFTCSKPATFNKSGDHVVEGNAMRNFPPFMSFLIFS